MATDRDMALAAAESALWDAYTAVHALRRSAWPVCRSDVVAVAVDVDRALVALEKAEGKKVGDRDGSD